MSSSKCLGQGPLSNYIPVLSWSETQACTNSLLFPIFCIESKYEYPLQAEALPCSKQCELHVVNINTVFLSIGTLWNHLTDSSGFSAADSEYVIASHPLNCLPYHFLALISVLQCSVLTNSAIFSNLSVLQTIFGLLSNRKYLHLCCA